MQEHIYRGSSAFWRDNPPRTLFPHTQHLLKAKARRSRSCAPGVPVARDGRERPVCTTGHTIDRLLGEIVTELDRSRHSPPLLSGFAPAHVHHRRIVNIFPLLAQPLLIKPNRFDNHMYMNHSRVWSALSDADIPPSPAAAAHPFVKLAPTALNVHGRSWRARKSDERIAPILVWMLA